MQNDIAERLAVYFEQLGLREISTADHSETTTRADADFAVKMGIWAKVAELRGPQLVADGYLTEAQRLAAVQDYTAWVATEADSMVMYLVAAFTDYCSLSIRKGAFRGCKNETGCLNCEGRPGGDRFSGRFSNQPHIHSPCSNTTT
jgi:hypothetical protein